MSQPIGYIPVGEMNRWPAERVLSVLRSVGVTYIDWNVAQFDALEAPASVLVDLASRTRAAGLETVQFSVPQDFVTEDAELWNSRVERTIKTIDACAQAGIRSIGAITGPTRWDQDALRVGVDISESRAWELADRAVERVLEHADGSGVSVCFEPVWGTILRSAWRFDKFLRRFENYPALGVTMDPSHFVLTDDDPSCFLAQWGHLVRHVHIKDAFGHDGLVDKDFMFTLPGEGAVPWGPFFAALNRLAYVGPLVVEFESFRLLDESLRADATAAATLSISLARGLVAKHTATLPADYLEKQK